jgi:CarD family transcriptional regulator
MYPRHGAAVIEDLVELELFGKRRAYFKLRPVHGNLTIMVPVEETEELGVREVASRGEIDKALEVLRQEEGSTPSLWSQRYKANLAKLTGGDISQMGEVVRDLSLKERRKPLSAGEKRMLVTARDILVSELTFAFDSTEEKIEVMLDEVLQEALVGRSVSCAPVRAALHTRRGPQPGPVAASTKPDAGH